MKRIIVAIRDVKVGEYMNLAHVKNKLEAQRHYLSILSEPRSPLYRFPMDYTIHELGIFDTETGVLSPSQVPTDITPYSERETIIVERNALENGHPKHKE